MNISDKTEENTTAITDNDILPVSPTSHARNQILGSVGLVCNVPAVTLLWLSNSIRPSLKISLISLSLSDLLMMAVAAVWRPSFPCWPALYIISTNVLVSYFSTAVLAFHNYLAVFYPTRCKQILTTSRTLVSLISCWLVGHLISLACLGLHIPNGSFCYVAAIMPRTGIVAESCICLLCCCFIIVTNLRVLAHTRKREKPGARSAPRAPQVGPKPGGSAPANIFYRNRASVAPISSSAPSTKVFQWQDATTTLATEVPSSCFSNATPLSSTEIMDGIDTTYKTYGIPQNEHFPNKKPPVLDLEQSNCIPNEIESNSPAENTKNERLILPHHATHSDISSISQSAGTSKNNRSVHLGMYDKPQTSKMSYLEVPVLGRLSKDIKRSVNDRSITDETGYRWKNQVRSKSAQRKGGPSEVKNNFIQTSASNEILTLDTDERSLEYESSEDNLSSTMTHHQTDLFNTTEQNVVAINNSTPASSGNLTSSTQNSPSSQENEIGRGTRSSVASVLPSLNRPHPGLSRLPAGRPSRSDNISRCWQRRTQYTLLILCSWCCMSSLPYIVYGGYIAIWIEDRASFLSSGLGILVSSLVPLSAITNPMLYAWRFVKWRDIWTKCKRRFRG